MAVFSHTKAKLNIFQIEEIEKNVNLKFPEEYKRHLLLFNGGRCSPNVFEFIENGVLTNSFIEWFLAIYDGEYNNLTSFIQIYKIDEKRLPNHILPFASDPGGNLICISCGEVDYGYIYFWDHENEVDYSISSDDYSNLYLIEKSFNKFLDGLTMDII